MKQMGHIFATLPYTTLSDLLAHLNELNTPGEHLIMAGKGVQYRVIELLTTPQVLHDADGYYRAIVHARVEESE